MGGVRKIWGVAQLVAAAVLAVSGAAHGQTADRAAPAINDASSAVVFMYHRFGEADYPSTNVTLDQFDAHLRLLAAGNHTVLPLADIVAALKSGAPLPKGTVGISVDDAYLSVYTEAWPRLRAAGYPFTLFVATDPVDRGINGYMSWAQIRELAAAGVTIGSQTKSHPHMADLSPAQNAGELARSNARFVTELGAQPALIAYPYGEASSAVIKTAKAAGFSAGFGQHSGGIGATSDMFFLARFALNEKYGDETRFKMAANVKHLPVTDVTPADMLIGPQNPPLIGFTIAKPTKNLAALACYASHEGKVAVQRLGETRFEIRMKQRLPAGRTRLNCTLPVGDGTWRWYGRQFYRLPGG